jgi:hypothetical protein
MNYNLASNTKEIYKTEPQSARPDDKIKDLIGEGYIYVHKSLWDYIPPGAHVKFIKKGEGGQSAAERFSQGGFVRKHFCNQEGKKFLLLETRPGVR